MACSLIKHKRISTTVAKAKALRVFIEPLITKSKDDTMHSRRVVFTNLKDKFAIKELFGEISTKIGDRPGGYTRILRTGNRLGDAAEMCIIELVDYNENMLKEKADKKTTRTRRGGKKATETAVPKATGNKETVKEVKAEAAEVEAAVKEAEAKVEEVKETVAENVQEVAEAAEEIVETTPTDATEEPKAEE